MLQTFDYNNEGHKELFIELVNDLKVKQYLSGLIDLIMSKSVQKFVFNIDSVNIGIGLIIPLKDKEVEIRYAIKKDYRGKNHARQLVKELIEQINPENTIYATSQHDNLASSKILLHNGFTTDDSFIYSIKR